MKRIGMVLHATRAEAAAAATKLSAALREAGVAIVALPGDASRIGDADGVQAFDDVDLVIAFGGDGTLLAAAEAVGPSSVPVMGINMGRLGFLSALEADDLAHAAERLLRDGVAVEERSTVVARIDGGAPIRALNDIIVEKRDAGRSIRLRVTIDGEPLVAWAADGVVVSSPTGSTAYSMSAGGPIVSPRVACLVVTPIAPHGLFARSVVVPPDEPIELRLLADSDPAGLSADGRAPSPLSAGASVAIAPGPTAMLARLEHASFWRLLREKFRLPAD